MPQGRRTPREAADPWEGLRREVGGSVDLGELLDETVVDGLSSLLQGGVLVSMGLTRDQGALGVTLTIDGHWIREYWRDAEALAAWMAGATRHLGNGASS